MKQSGYTLVEILVAVSIFTMMTAYVVSNFRTVNNSDRLKADLARLTSVIREARASAFNGVIPKGQNSYPLGGYGIYFNKLDTTYTLFADINGDGFYDPDLTDPKEAIQAYTFSENIQIKTLTKSSVIKIMSMRFNGRNYPKFQNQTCSNQPPGPPDFNLCLPAITSNFLNKGIIVTLSATNSTCLGTINISDSPDSDSLLVEDNVKGC